jgi:hypothetical protein
MGWIALPNLRAVYVAYVDIESNRRVGTNFDRIKKCEIDLHGSSLPKDHGSRRANRQRSRVYSTVDEIRSYVP